MHLSKKRATAAVVAAAAVALTPVAAAVPAAADTAQAAGSSADGSHIASVQARGRNLVLQVYSAAMHKNIEVDVQRPADTSAPAPTLYLLNGAGGGQDSATWSRETDVSGFLADKHLNVVTPIGGAWSYYTDWRATDPTLGLNMWKTFLTTELPPLIDRALNTNGVNAIAGLSMSGTSVLQLPIAAPGLYKSVAALSGCAQISDPIGYDFVKTVVSAGGGDTANMYGPKGDPMWAANDPYVHADQLRGLNLFLSSGSGLPGRYDTLSSPFLQAPGPGGLANEVAVGGALEAAVNYCSHNMQTKLNQLGIPATYDFESTGTHSWGYWQDELEKSWPVLARGLGLPAN
ncbi:diacylglycerol O-acyltransferase/trehalose O-mycolyltransferase [Nocardia sp. GAS34]|uniref:alpha/beta hydrolase n=1 Tax=unclassified Nocardia TaxID=2637762 RepID=UPI003D206469